MIKAVEDLGTRQGIKSLKIQKHGKPLFTPSHWIAGVDYIDTQNNTDQDPDVDDAYDPTVEVEDDIELDEEEMEQLDQQEINELLADSHKPVVDPRDVPQEPHNNDDEADDETADPNPIVSDHEDATDQESQEGSTAGLRRSSRAPKPVGKLYLYLNP